MKRKEKKKKKWAKKWDYIGEKMNDWGAGQKVGDWSASLEMDERFDEKTRDWLRAAGLYNGGRGHMISITSVVKSLMVMNLIIWLMIVSGLIVNDIRRWYDYLDDAVDAIICCTKHWSMICVLSLTSICYEYVLYIYTIYVPSALAIDLRSIYDRSISRVKIMIDAMNTF